MHELEGDIKTCVVLLLNKEKPFVIVTTFIYLLLKWGCEGNKIGGGVEIHLYIS